MKILAESVYTGLATYAWVCELAKGSRRKRSKTISGSCGRWSTSTAISNVQTVITECIMNNIRLMNLVVEQWYVAL